jgi:hypothetical protein
MLYIGRVDGKTSKVSVLGTRRVGNESVICFYIILLDIQVASSPASYRAQFAFSFVTCPNDTLAFPCPKQRNKK